MIKSQKIAQGKLVRLVERKADKIHIVFKQGKI